MWNLNCALLHSRKIFSVASCSSKFPLQKLLLCILQRILSNIQNIQILMRKMFRLRAKCMFKRKHSSFSDILKGYKSLQYPVGFFPQVTLFWFCRLTYKIWNQKVKGIRRLEIKSEALFWQELKDNIHFFLNLRID